MALFNRNNDEQVPEIEVQGENATIPTPEGKDEDEFEVKKVKVPQKSWGRN